MLTACAIQATLRQVKAAYEGARTSGLLTHTRIDTNAFRYTYDSTGGVNGRTFHDLEVRWSVEGLPSSPEQLEAESAALHAAIERRVSIPVYFNTF